MVMHQSANVIIGPTDITVKIKMSHISVHPYVLWVFMRHITICLSHFFFHENGSYSRKKASYILLYSHSFLLLFLLNKRTIAECNNAFFVELSTGTQVRCHFTFTIFNYAIRLWNVNDNGYGGMSLSQPSFNIPHEKSNTIIVSIDEFRRRIASILIWFFWLTSSSLFHSYSGYSNAIWIQLDLSNSADSNQSYVESGCRLWLPRQFTFSLAFSILWIDDIKIEQWLCKYKTNSTNLAVIAQWMHCCLHWPGHTLTIFFSFLLLFNMEKNKIIKLVFLRRMYISVHTFFFISFHSFHCLFIVVNDLAKKKRRRGLKKPTKMVTTIEQARKTEK